MPDDSSDSAPAAPRNPARRASRPGPLGWVIRYTRGLILDQHFRRLTMFYLIIAAMLMAFAGDILFGRWLEQNPWRLLAYYLACAWLTIAAALLAIYDLLMVRLQHRLTRRRLRTHLLGDEPDNQE